MFENVCGRRKKFHVWFVTLLVQLCGFIQSQNIMIKDEIGPNKLIKDLSESPAFSPHYLRDKVKFQFFNADKLEHFLEIQPGTGEVYSRQKIDRDTICATAKLCCENKKLCSLPISVGMRLLKRSSSSSSDSLLSSAEPLIQQFNIVIEDVNDNAPKFNPATFNISISESVLAEKSFALPIASDADSNIFSVKKCQMKYQSSTMGRNGQYLESIFGIESNLNSDNKLTCWLKLKQQLDREKVKSYRIIVVAIDGGMPSLTGTLTVNVNVEDANDNAPKFDKEQYRIDVEEGKFPDKPILTVHATDKDIDINGRVIYKMNPLKSTAGSVEFFSIKPNSGELSLLRALDYEQRAEYKLIITASNDDTQNSLKTSTATVLITVLNINDEKPQIVINYWDKKKRALIRENEPPNYFVAFITVKDKDKGMGRYVDCKLVNENSDSFVLSNSSPGNFKLMTSKRLDREKQSEYRFIVRCNDDGNPPLTSDKTVLITIKDDNDNSPIIKSPKLISVSENLPINSKIYTIVATDEDDGDNSKLRYRISRSEINDNFNNYDIEQFIRINEMTGIISTVKKIDREEYDTTLDKIDFLLTVSDSGEVPRSTKQNMQLIITDVNDNPPKFPKTTFQFDVDENKGPDQVLGQIEVTDADINTQDIYDSSSSMNHPKYPRNPIRLSISYKKSHYMKAPFKLVSKNDQNSHLDTSLPLLKQYWLQTTQSLDWEKQSQHELIVIATDKDFGYSSKNRRRPKIHSTTATIIVTVNDLNDNAPEFIFPKPPIPSAVNSSLSSKIVHTLSWKQSPGFVLLTVRAHDKDNPKTGNGQFYFSVHGGSGSRLVSIDSNLGQIKTNRYMEEADIGEYIVWIRVQDNGIPPQHSDISIRFRIVDLPAQFTGGADGNSGDRTKYDGYNRPYDPNGNRYGKTNYSFLAINKEGILILALVLMLVIFVLCVSLVAYMRHARGWCLFLPDILGTTCVTGADSNSRNNNGSGRHNQYTNGVSGNTTITDDQQQRLRKQRMQAAMLGGGSQLTLKMCHGQVQNMDTQPQAYRPLIHGGVNNLVQEDDLQIKNSRDYYEILKLENDMMRNQSPGNQQLGFQTHQMYNQQQHPYSNMNPPISNLDPHQSTQNYHIQQQLPSASSFEGNLHDSYLSLNQCPPPIQQSTRHIKTSTMPASMLSSPEIQHKSGDAVGVAGKKPAYAVSYPADQSTFV